jgi:hypothetical protein
MRKSDSVRAWGPHAASRGVYAEASSNDHMGLLPTPSMSGAPGRRETAVDIAVASRPFMVDSIGTSSCEFLRTRAS